MGKTPFEITPTAPYNFDLHWKFYSSSEPQAETYEKGVWRRLFKIGDKKFPVAVCSVGTVDKPRLKIDVYFKTSVAEKKELSDKIIDFFKIRSDIAELYKFMDKDEVLRKVKNRLYGLRPPGIGLDMFESMVRVIIQQQISLRVAYVMTGALVKKFGEKIEINGERYYDFPSPEVLATTSIEELRRCKLSQQKSKYIKGLALNVANGYDLEKIREMDDDKAVEELMKFKGIGRWSAELILIAALERMNLCVPDDLGARKAVSHFYFNGELQSGDVIRKFTERWGEFKGWVIYYLICAYNMENRREV